MPITEVGVKSGPNIMCVRFAIETNCRSLEEASEMSKIIFRYRSQTNAFEKPGQVLIILHTSKLRTIIVVLL